jgi:hypothetical protein
VVAVPASKGGVVTGDDAASKFNTLLWCVGVGGNVLWRVSFVCDVVAPKKGGRCLTEPAVIAAGIAEDLEAALGQFAEIGASLSRQPEDD